MHLGNNAVTPTCALLGFGAAALGAGLAVWVDRRGRGKEGPPIAPLRPWEFAAAAAAVFALQMGNVTVLGGQSSGHFMGGLLLAICFGPAWGLLGVALVLAVQSILFADGGLLVLGLNVLNMGVVPCLMVYPLWSRIARRRTGFAWWASVGAAAWASMVLAAVFASLELLSQPGALSKAGPLLVAMLSIHALIGVLEAGGTVVAVAASRSLRRLPRGAAVLVTSAALAGGVLLADTFASPFPDGLEFSLEQLGLHGLSTAMIDRVESIQQGLALWPDYSVVWGAVLACALTGMIGFLAVQLRTARVNMEGVRQA